MTLPNLRATITVQVSTPAKNKQKAAPLSANVGIAATAVSHVYVLKLRQAGILRNVQPNRSMDGKSVVPNATKQPS